MGKTSNETKQKWNATHYTQIKISVSLEVATAFKAFCSASGMSMAKALSLFMDKRAADGEVHPIRTRNQRRKEAERLIKRLSQIREAEESYRDNIPENLQASVRYEAAEQANSLIDEAISLIEEAY
jgi:antitoxin component of RelBE/YafQ-DinJ toxin-antitoxin module